MTLSVVIPAFGREPLLIRCLTALSRTLQMDAGEYEVCVVDDGSSIDSGMVREAVSPGYPLLWRTLSENRGRSVARNEGIAATTGDIVVFLDADVEAEPGMLAAHRHVHETTPRAAVIGRIGWPQDTGFRRYIGSRGVAKLRDGAPVPPQYFVTGNASVRREDLPSQRPFDESLPGWGGEDLALGLRLAAGGVTFLYEPGAGAYHHFDGDLAGHIARTYRYGRDALPVLVARHPELTDVLRLGILRSPVWRMLVNDRLRSAAARLANASGRLSLPDIFYDYLTYAAYARGWLDREDS